MSQIIIEGNLGNDPSFITKGDNMRLELFLLENFDRQNSDTGEREKTGTLAHNVVLFGKRAELWQHGFKKGMRVLVAGEQKATTFNSDGEDKTSTSIIVDHIAVVPFGVEIQQIQQG